MTLAEEYRILFRRGVFDMNIPIHITSNLSHDLREYQKDALKFWTYYIDKDETKPQGQQHLLFHMATGSGKTVLMAALILDLYQRGYRNFLFFVNATQIVEKTKDNFLNPASSKHLFASQIRIDDKPVEIRTVETFDASSKDAINIHFTTIQGLHSRMENPKENSVTIEDFSDYKVVMISDEAHHLNALTRRRLNDAEEANRVSWEGTASKIFQQHPKNMLLEFTATVDLEHEEIRKKYHDKILYDYSLRQFREDGYSKDIELRQAHLPPAKRMLQAMVLSQYRRKVAEAYGVRCKPVILMKSKTISDSGENEAAFAKMLAGLSAEVLKALRTASKGDKTLSRAFDFIMNKRAMSAAEFAQELRVDFASEKVVNVNNNNDLKNRQIELNALEDPCNEIRVIFAVNKLNEGWDVLNLFDIVRLYDTRDGKDNKVGPTTMAEAQLIGRGARYFPFEAPDQPDAAQEKRKYDNAVENPLRILEELHYHCSHNPKYIQDIRNALRETGMLDEKARTVQLRLKDEFKQTDLYNREHVWMNARVKNTREDVDGLDAYKIKGSFEYTEMMTGRVTEESAFDSTQPAKPSVEETVSQDFKLVDFGLAVLRFAMDSNEFFHFTNLKTLFPKLTSSSQFLTSKAYLGEAKVAVRGLPEDLDNLSASQKLEIAQYVLHEIESGVNRERVDFVGTRDFKPFKISDRFTDKTLKLGVMGETGRSWTETELEGLDQIDLNAKDWHAYDDNYGTDQEKHFIVYLNDRAEQLKKRYDKFYLLRNDKAVKLFDFDTGEGFEPDFVLFLRKKGQKKTTFLQLFIEPKGKHLQQDQAWKQEFLMQIKAKAKLEVKFQGKDYSVFGLPFFNWEGQANEDFREVFEGEFPPE